ncbi:MAG: NADH:flavin oxidoreductase, partial [Chloroflexi bacterium]|nr:NADH:flavin oxidoreductase [Chloroflexota bacterium]
VVLAEARRELGGRVALESRLPGLSEWRRVADWRLTQLEKLRNVTVYRSSEMSGADVLEAGFAHVLIATGAVWRRDGVGGTLWRPIPGCDLPHVWTPDDLLGGLRPSGSILIYDDDHYYMGGVLAELLAAAGCRVTLATPAALVSSWTEYTLEQGRIQRRLMDLGARLETQKVLQGIGGDTAVLTHTISGAEMELACDGVVLVTDRLPNDALYRELKPALVDGKLASLQLIGDALAPDIIAQAVFSGYRAAYDFDAAPVEGVPFRVERTAL